MNYEITMPKGEHVWTGYYNKDDDLMFIITSKQNSRDTYYIYENQNDSLVKLGKSSNPLELAAKFNVIEKIHGEKQNTINE